MPVTKSATKKLRVDRRRYVFNLRLKKRYKAALKKHLKQKTLETLKRVYALLDRAVKRHIIHQNKAARLKSKAAKLVAQTTPSPKRTKTRKTSSRKTTKPTNQNKSTKKKS